MKITFLFALLYFFTTHLTAQNDISLDSVRYQTLSDTGLSNYYSRIPHSQAKLDTLHFTALVTNHDSVAQTNLVFQNIIITPTGIDTLFSNPINLNPFQSDSIQIPSPFTFEDGIGNYSWVFSISSDSTDGNLYNNQLDTIEALVTDTTFSRDFNGSGNFWMGHGVFYEIGTMFEIFDTIRATSISVGFGNNTPPGTVISLRIYDSTLTSPITSREFITLPSAIITDSFSTFIIPDILLKSGKYFATIASFSDSLFLKYSLDADANRTFLDSNQNGNWSQTKVNPLIRLNISNHLHCDLNVEAKYLGSDSVLAVVTGGNPPYSYHWNTGDSTSLITNIIPYHPFTYDVTVTDDSACLAHDYVSFYDNITEILFDGNITIYPNPNNGTFQLKLTEMNSGNYTISIKNTLGKLMFQNYISIGGIYEKPYSLPNLKSGVYFLEIRNDSDQKSVVKFVVNK